MLRLSLAVPVYDVAAFLPAFLEGLAAQWWRAARRSLTS